MNATQIIKANPVSSVLFATDIIGLYLSFSIAYQFRIGSALPFTLSLVTLLFSTLVCLYLFNTYRVEKPDQVLKAISRSTLAICGATVFAILIGFIVGREQFIPIFGRTVLLITFLIFAIWVAISRYLLARFSWRSVQQKWLFIGERSKADFFLEDVNKQKNFGLVHCLISEENLNQAQLNEFTIQLQQSWNGIIIDSLSALPDTLSSQLVQARLAGQKVFTLTELYTKLWNKVPIFHLGNQWLIDVDGFSLLEDSINYKFKRLFDFGLSFILGLLIIPLIIIIAITIKINSPGPAFYNQARVGMHSKPFKLYKFRTMINNAESKGAQWSQKNDPRITSLGKFLRASRLDELPQIYNVLKGQMSFIGPRPERPEFVTQLEQEIPYYDLRHIVKPGITGWAQVMHDYGSSVEDAKEKLQYDLFYVKYQSILLDSLILLKTAKTILSARGR